MACRLFDINFSKIHERQKYLYTELDNALARVSRAVVRSFELLDEQDELRNSIIKTHRCKCCHCNKDEQQPCLCFDDRLMINCCHAYKDFEHEAVTEVLPSRTVEQKGESTPQKAAPTFGPTFLLALGGLEAYFDKATLVDSSTQTLNEATVFAELNLALELARAQSVEIEVLKRQHWEYHVNWSAMTNQLTKPLTCRCCCCHFEAGSCPCRHCQAGLEVCCVYGRKEYEKHYYFYKGASQTKKQLSQ